MSSDNKPEVEVDMDEFGKWKLTASLIKVRLKRRPLQDTDMEDVILNDARDHVVTGIEKYSAPPNMEVSFAPN